MDDLDIRVSNFKAILVNGLHVSWATQEDKDEYIAWYVNNVVTEEDTTGNAYAPDENGEYHRDDNDIDFLRDLNDIAWK